MNVRNTITLLQACSWGVVITSTLAVGHAFISVSGGSSDESPATVTVSDPALIETLRVAHEAEQTLKKQLHAQAYHAAFSRALWVAVFGAVGFGALQFMAGVLFVMNSFQLKYKPRVLAGHPMQPYSG